MSAFLTIAAIVWLFALDRTRRPMTSPALWIAVLWWAIVATRPVSSWFSGGLANYQSPDELVDGSPVDAAVYLILLSAATIELYRRQVAVGSVLARNSALCVFMLYFVISVVWSDYPAVAIKRWIKDYGNVAVALLVVTEIDPRAAVRALLGRCIYLTVPTSVLFIKYWPDLGRYYDRWTWTPFYSGVTLEKNALGALAMFAALFLLWDLLYGRSEGPNLPASVGPSSGSAEHRRDVLYLASQLAVLYMALWLIFIADSSNALVCFIMGAVVIVALGTTARHSAHLIRHLWSYSLVIVLLTGALVALTDISDMFLDELGEDITLTGRTAIWSDVIDLIGNTLIGAGYQSFWLGGFGKQMWERYIFHPNQAHNGYIETYLNGGWIGLLLLAAFLVTTLVRLRSELLLRRDAITVLFFSLFVVAILYNISEAMFNNMSLVWLITLLAAVTYTKAPSATAAGAAGAMSPEWS